jgi:hypothetical protein
MRLQNQGRPQANLILPTCSTDVEVKTGQMGAAVLVAIEVADLGSMRDSEGPPQSRHCSPHL